MGVPTTVTMVDIAGNIADKPTYMAVQINGEQYPEKHKPKGLFAKVMTYTPFEHGLLKIDRDQLTFCDEKGKAFKTLTTGDLTQVELAMYHAMVRIPGPVVPMRAQYTVTLQLTTTSNHYELLISAPNVVPVLVDWLQSQKLAYTDPLDLAKMGTDFDWEKITEAQFGRWSKGTPYEKFAQTIGSERVM